MKRQRAESLKKEQKEIENTTNSNPIKQLSKFDKSKSNFNNYDSSKEKTLPREFFRQQVVQLAEKLLGKVFIRKTDKGFIKAIIVQTQAYKAPLDKACHAYNNKKTDRTKYFWLDGGHLYLYTIYMPTNLCLNVVAGLEGQPEAVLIRGVQPIQGIQLMKQLRSIKSQKLQDLCNGPGKIGMALNINKQKMNGMDLIDGDDFKIVDAGIKDFDISTSRRINIDYAQEWIDKQWRFYIEGNSYVSKVDLNKPAKPKKKKQ